MVTFADCRDTEVLVTLHRKLTELRSYVAICRDTCHSVHAEAELDILADILANQAESLELCAQECSDIERETSWLDQYERLKP